MSETSSAARTPLGPIVLVVALFFLWGVANHLNDILIPQFKHAFTLTDFQSGLVQSAFYLGYFIFADPGRFVHEALRLQGRRDPRLAALPTKVLLFTPAASLLRYEVFLGALFVIASGLAFLETSANPLVTVLGPQESSERQLNFAQAFNPLGALTGVFVGSTFILGSETGAQDGAAAAQAVQLPYLALGGFVLLWAAIVTFTPFPAVAGAKAARDEGPGRFRTFSRLGASAPSCSACSRSSVTWARKRACLAS